MSGMKMPHWESNDIDFPTVQVNQLKNVAFMTCFLMLSKDILNRLI